MSGSNVQTVLVRFIQHIRNASRIFDGFRLDFRDHFHKSIQFCCSEIIYIRHFKRKVSEINMVLTHIISIHNVCKVWFSNIDW